MIIASLVLICGLAIGILATELYDLRMGGVVVVPLVSIYALYNVYSLPVFAISVLAAYASLRIMDRRILLYGRQRLGATIVIGAALPVLMLLFIRYGLGRTALISEIEFAGSILPGVAAYNLDRLDPAMRKRDVLAGMSTFLGLAALAILSVHLWLTPPCTTCHLLGWLWVSVPTFLVSPLSHVAGLFGAGYGQQPPVMGSEFLVLLVVVFGILITEAIRKRWGLRPMGVVALALLALFALRSRWLLVLYPVSVAAAYAGIQWLHWRTLLYGRVLLSFAIAISVLVGVAATMLLPITAGLAGFFTAVLGGVGAFHLHAQAPAERPRTVLVSLGAFVVIVGLARLLLTPLPGGLMATIAIEHLVAGGAAVAVGLWHLYTLEARMPSNETILAGSVHSAAEGPVE